MSITTPRPHKRADGFATRADTTLISAAELAVLDAMRRVEEAGASAALTDAVTLLAKAKDRIADHYEGIEAKHSTLAPGRPEDQAIEALIAVSYRADAAHLSMQLRQTRALESIERSLRGERAPAGEPRSMPPHAYV